MVDFREIIETLQDWHFYDVFLPFILVYVVIFAILEKSKIFNVKDGGDGANKHVKNVNAIIAFVFALFVVASLQTVLYIQSFITNIILFIIFILVVLILLAFIFGSDYMKLFMHENGTIKGWAAWTVGIVVFIVALGVFLWVIGALDWLLDYLDDLNIEDGDFGAIVIIAIIGIVLYFITRGDSKPSNSNSEPEKDDNDK